MIKRFFYSKVEPNKLLHIVIHAENDGFGLKQFECSRENVSPEKEFLQLGIIKQNKGKKYQAHKHKELVRETNRTCESWIVIKGSVKSYLYDLNDQIMDEVILEEGDLSITFEGAHNYEIIKDGTFVYEFKSGPYLNVDMDKENINE